MIMMPFARFPGLKSLKPEVVFGDTLYPVFRQGNGNYAVRKLIRHWRTGAGQLLWDWEYFVMDAEGVVVYCTNRKQAKVYVGKVRFTGMDEALAEYGGET